MRICFFADAESIHTIRWCKYFQSLGHEIHLVSFKKAQIENVTVHVISGGKVDVKGGNWKLLFKYRSLKKILKLIRPDVLHSHYATSYGITGALCNFHPYIITALGTDILITPKKSLVYRIGLKFALRKADFITVMSDQMKVEVETLGNFSRKVITLPFGIDPKVFNSEGRAVPEDSIQITSTRNFEEVYNIPDLLHAFKTVKQKIPNTYLNLIGDGSKRVELEELVQELGVSDAVTFYGRIAQSEIADILKKSHLFVSVSSSDGNNISLNEAMACQCLSVVTDIPANRQWIHDGVNGFLVAVNDVEELANKIELACGNYAEMQASGRALNDSLIEERGIWSNNMKKMELIYHQLIQNK